MAKNKKKYWFILGFFFFGVYCFLAARPVPVETILTRRWISSLESAYPDSEETESLLPFTLGDRFGYVDSEGRYTVNQVKKGYVALSEEYWTEYEAVPETIEVLDPGNNSRLTIENGRGYPLFLDKRIFLVKEEQNAIAELDVSGAVLWTYDFTAPITCIDAAAGLVAAGSLEGSVELLDNRGKRIFFFEPGASRLSVILGCRISGDGSYLAVVSGIDDQRFLVLERFGDSYKVIYHEFLEDGFRRNVHLAFTDRDRRILFEREGGLGIYEINARNSLKLPLQGEIAAVDESGGDDLLFLVLAQGERRKRLVAVRFPGMVIINAPFQSEDVFFKRRNSRLYIGGGMTLASFELDKR
ncbi:MAG: WD40 repeat domain-containing protein [Treponema sp.]|nr:WD40 repeat domain-containing protein [Treponema sp.]